MYPTADSNFSITGKAHQSLPSYCLDGARRSPLAGYALAFLEILPEAACRSTFCPQAPVAPRFIAGAFSQAVALLAKKQLTPHSTPRRAAISASSMWSGAEIDIVTGGA